MTKPYYQDEYIIQHCSDALTILRELESDSVDLLCTDPPYGIAFMSKSWDKALPDKRIWAECLRVLKPGAFAFVMSIPRQDCLSRMIISLEDAGFNVGFTPIYWAYACLSADTEVLTQDGWKDWERLRKSSNCAIMVYDAEKGNYWFEPPSAWNSYSIREDMFRIESEDTEQLVTHNHRVYTSRGFILAENLKEQDEVVFLPSVPSDICDISCGDKKKAGYRRDVLLDKLSPESECLEMYKTQREAWNWWAKLDRGTEATPTRSNDGGKESSLERRCDLLQDTRELCRSEVCEMPTGISSNGSQRRLYYGASLACSSTTGETIIENRGCPPQQPQSSRQQSDCNAFCQQSGPQEIRGGASYKTTLARIDKQYYEGIVYCPTVSTGCFVARRNGKVFLTGNSGFPKAQNISKAVDKRGGEYFGRKLCNLIKKRRLELNLSTIQLAEQGGFYGKVNHGGTVSNWEEGKGVPTIEQFNKLIDILGLEESPIVEAEREVIGRHPTIKGHGSVFNMEFEGYPMITAPSTPQAKALDGSYGGFQPKPAVEVIIVAMKPLSEKTYVDQALKNRKGCTWLDDCRVPYESEADKQSTKIGFKSSMPVKDGWHGHDETFKPESNMEQSGRFPANLLVSDDVLNDGKERLSRWGKARNVGQDMTTVYEGGFRKRLNSGDAFIGDSGSFSRYFDLDKWAAKTFPFLIVPKASKSEKNKGLENNQTEIGHNRFDQCASCGGYLFQNPDRQSACKCDNPIRKHNKVKGNHHPTVKPIKLMSYLITLGSRAGDMVLDPFLGSGTTALASKLLNRKCIGIELNEKYCEIAAMRSSQGVFDLR